MKWSQGVRVSCWLVLTGFLCCLIPLTAGAQDACDLSPADVCYGDGGDGSVVVTTDTVLDGDKNYQDLRVAPGVTLDTAGHVVRVCGTLLNEGIITDLQSGGSCGTIAGGRGQDLCQNSGGPPEAEPGSCVCMCYVRDYPEAGVGGSCGCGGGGGGAAGKSSAPCYDADGGAGGTGGYGGKGGGYVRIHAFILDNQGTIHADGQAGGPGERGEDGLYWVAREGRCRDFAGGGGGGGAGGAGGDGGTVELYYSQLVNLNPIDIHANPGTGAAGAAGGLSGTTLHGGPLECDEWPETAGQGALGGCHGEPVEWCGGDGGDGAWQQGTLAEDGDPGDPGPAGNPGQVMIVEPEACCLDGGQTCADVDPGCCSDLGGSEPVCGDHCLGDHNGNDIDDACEPCEACCLPSGACEVRTWFECVDSFGVPQGPGSTCAGLWSCCSDDLECMEIDEICCDEWNDGVPGTTDNCADLNENDIADACEDLEACCLESGTCELRVAADCVVHGGTPQGPGTTCGGLWSCCDEDGQCVQRDTTCCDEWNDSVPGATEDCLGDNNGNDIDDACEYQACCLPSDTCEVLFPSDCEARFGTPQGPGSTCAGLWSCCNEEGECREIDLVCCDEWENGVPGTTEQCEEDSCILPEPPGCLGTWVAAPLNTGEETTCVETPLKHCGREGGDPWPVTEPPLVRGDRDITDWVWDNDDESYTHCMMFMCHHSPYDIQLADDFIPCADVSINHVQWFLGWWGSGNQPAITAVRVLFYQDDVANPGHPTGGGLADPETTAVYNRLYPWGNVTYTPGPYSRTWECELDLTTPFVATEGQRYWFAVQLVGAWEMPPYVGWLAAGQVKEEVSKEHGWEADNLWYDQVIGSDNYDLAFSLYGDIVNPAVCGDNVAEGCEECDGTDNVLCGAGACIDPGEPGECTCTYLPCVLDCPFGAINGEPTEPCDDSTQVNAGCNFDPPDPGSAEDALQCGVTVCGHSWLTDWAVDYDQYAVVLPTDQIMTVTFEAEFPAFCGFLAYNEGDEGSGDCNDLAGTWYSHATPKCTVRTFSNVQGSAHDECVPAGTYFLQIAVNWDQSDQYPCSSPYEENLYWINLECEPCTVLQCPENSLFEQVVQGEDSGTWFATASDEDIGLTWYEDFSDVYGDVCDIHFWGLIHDNVTGEDCTEDPMEFEVRFFQPDGLTQIGATYTIWISPVDTYHVYDPDPGVAGDEMTLWEFSAELAPCVDLHGMDGSNNPTTDGWVSIRALGHNSCLFYWAAADACDGGSRLWDEETEAFCDNLVDLSLCLTGEEPAYVLGACCYEPTADCTQSIYGVCEGAGYRFEAYRDCPGDTTFGAEIDPPCGVIEGACCDPETGFCSLTTMDECWVAGGTFTAHGTCDPNTCYQPDPCDGPTTIYEQTPYDNNPEAMPFSYRNYGEVGIITAADVTFESATEITDFHWWATDGACFNWTGFADVLVYPDAGGAPQADPSHARYDVPSYRAYYNGETVCDGDLDVVIYTVILGDPEFCAIKGLDAGTYWIGMRPVGLLYDWSAVMVTSEAIGQPYRQKWDEEGAWIPEEAGEPDIAFCLTYFETGPCCGDGFREGSEECDGADDSACPGECLADCTCPVCGDNIRQGGEECDGTDDAACPGECTPPGEPGECTCRPPCPGSIISASPPDGTIDARKPHLPTSTTPCYGFGMPDDPGTPTKDESTFYPIEIDLGVAGADAECWELCETPDMSASDCGSNSIASVTDNGDGTYTIILNHGIQGGTVATIQYNGGDYVTYIHHPANADAKTGSASANANDILYVIDCLRDPGSCEDYEADIDASGVQGANDIIEEIDLLNGAGAYCPWFGTTLPVNGGDCP